MPRYKLIAVAGPSCAGKTTLLNYLAYAYDYEWITCITTRPKRRDDNVSRYQYVTEEKFFRQKKEGTLLWSNKIGAYWYGTPQNEIYSALTGRGYYMLDVSVDRFEMLANNACDLDSSEDLGLFYIDTLNGLLESRLSTRGYADWVIDSSLILARKWRQVYKNFCSSGIDIHCIPNNGSFRQLFQKMEDCLK